MRVIKEALLLGISHQFIPISVSLMVFNDREKLGVDRDFVRGF